MARSLQRLNQIGRPDSPDDQKTAEDIAASEGTAANFSEFFEMVLSQIKRVIHGNEAGNWCDDPVTVFGSDASLRALLDRPSSSADLDALLITSDGGLIYDSNGVITVKENL